jgi:hypothetical protein
MIWSNEDLAQRDFGDAARRILNAVASTLQSIPPEMSRDLPEALARARENFEQTAAEIRTSAQRLEIVESLSGIMRDNRDAVKEWLDGVIEKLEATKAYPEIKALVAAVDQAIQAAREIRNDIAAERTGDSLQTYPRHYQLQREFIDKIEETEFSQDRLNTGIGEDANLDPLKEKVIKNAISMVDMARRAAEFQFIRLDTDIKNANAECEKFPDVTPPPLAASTELEITSAGNKRLEGMKKQIDSMTTMFLSEFLAYLPANEESAQKHKRFTECQAELMQAFVNQINIFVDYAAALSEKKYESIPAYKKSYDEEAAHVQRSMAALAQTMTDMIPEDSFLYADIAAFLNVVEQPLRVTRLTKGSVPDVAPSWTPA